MRIDLSGAEGTWIRGLLAAPRAWQLSQALLADIPWEVHRIRLFGREVDSPRLSCWIGDPDARYRYSGTEFRPHAWPAALSALRARLAAECGAAFNSVLVNRYRD